MLQVGFVLPKENAMRREDCVDMFKRIPDDMHPQVNLVLGNRFVLTVESVARFEPTYLVFRGREGGTSDDGRAFFVPYEEISYIRIEREVRMGEIKKMYGETGFIDPQDRLMNEPEVVTEESKTNPSSQTPVSVPVPPPSPVIPSDPGSIAKQNLLDRIRATRANAAGATAKTGNGGK
jgi:hypothetical protein